MYDFCLSNQGRDKNGKKKMRQGQIRLVEALELTYGLMVA
jgi:hypothetical protein